MKLRYKIITKFEDLKKVIDGCVITGYASFDFETAACGPYGLSIGDDKKPNGPQYKEDYPTIISIGFQPGYTYSIPLYHKESPFDEEQVKCILDYIGENIMANPNIIKIAWNLKFEMKWFIRFGWKMLGILLDGMLAKYILEEERPHDLKSMVARLYPQYAHYEEEVRVLARINKGWANVPLKPLSKYCCIDSDLTLRITLYLERILIRKGYNSLFRNMCMMQTRVLAESEMMGLGIDREYLQRIIKEQGTKIQKNHRNLLKIKIIRRFQKWRIETHIKNLIDEAKREIEGIKKGEITYRNPQAAIQNRLQKISRYIVGQLITKKEKIDEVNFNSPDQMVKLLFDSPRGFKFKIVKYTKDDHKQDTDRPSTDEEVLLTLKKKDKTGFIKALLDHREMTKLYSTYMVAIDYRMTQENRIHGSFLIHGTVTGRLSSKDPNLQNIPRTITSSLIKTMYIPPKGHLLLEIDYGQAELRVVAELAKDEAMIEIFKKGYNVHVATGAKINHAYDRYDEIKNILKDPKHKEHEFWEKQKKKGKVLNFSILYLQSDEMTAEQMSDPEKGEIVTVEEAAEFKEEWFNQFPKIREWMEDQKWFVKENGYVVNMFGRKRRLPDIYSDLRGEVNKAIRDAINAPIQGASSDFTQFASIIIREKIKKGELICTDDKRYSSQAYTVHDSLGFYVMPKYIHTVIPKIIGICEDPETFKYFGFQMEYVKMKANAEIGKTWGSLLDYDENENYEKWLNP